jgi:hypothetical protein
MAADETVKYRATSAFTDPITIVNVVSLVLLSQDVRAIIPVAWMPFVAALIAVFNIVMQVVPLADRPVRLNIVPGDSKPVDVPKLK